MRTQQYKELGEEYSQKDQQVQVTCGGNGLSVGGKEGNLVCLEKSERESEAGEGGRGVSHRPQLTRVF